MEDDIKDYMRGLWFQAFLDVLNDPATSPDVREKLLARARKRVDEQLGEISDELLKGAAKLATWKA